MASLVRRHIIEGHSLYLLHRYFYREHDLIFYTWDDEPYCAYLSISEGLWRLTVWVIGNTLDTFPNTYFKGEDYITTTQLHIALQCIFNQNYNFLPELEEFSQHYIDMFYTNAYDARGTRILKEVTGYYHLGKKLWLHFSHARKFNHPVFEPLAVACTTGNCFKNTYEMLYGKTSPIRTAGSFFGVNQYYKKLQDLLGINVKGSHINSNLYKSKNIVSDELRYSTIVHIYSEYMRHFFNLSAAAATPICETTMKIPGTETTFPLQIYKTTISLKSDGTAFDLIYATYTIPADAPVPAAAAADPNAPPPPRRPSPASYIAGSYKLIINLLPTRSEIGAFGLNKTYISAGIYMYKMFEYAGRQVVRNTYRYADYHFIGDLLTKMWPLEEVRETAAAGGKRKTQRQKTRRVRQTRSIKN